MIWPTVIRGLSELYGSWKITCMRRRTARSAVSPAAVRSRVEAKPLPAGAPGLYHVAFCVGSTREDLQAARREAEQAGLQPFGETGGATPCFCVKDPDGHTVELYAALSA